MRKGRGMQSELILNIKKGKHKKKKVKKERIRRYIKHNKKKEREI